MTTTNALTVLSGVLNDFRLNWRPLLATHLLYTALTLALFIPLTSLLLRALMSLSGDAAVADLDIVLFLLHPVGLIALIIGGAIIATIIGLEYAALMAIGYFRVQGEALGFIGALRYAAGHARNIVLLAARMIVRTLLYAAPFLAIAALAFILFLTQRDINFYLAEKPPVFWLASLLIGICLIGMFIVLIRTWVGWFYALPLVLFAEISPADAFAKSRQVVGDNRITHGMWLVGWMLSGIILTALAGGTVTVLGNTVVPLVANFINLLAVTIGGLLVLAGLFNLTISFISASALSLIIIHLYRRAGFADKPAHSNAVSTWNGPAMPWGWGITLNIRTLVWGCVAGLSGAIVIGYALLSAFPGQDTVQIIAHRGASDDAPENTLSAIKKAIEAGAEWVEIDVQETADGKVVVIHDSDLSRITGQNLKIWDATFEQLQSIDIGSWFDPRFADQRVPSLRQVLETCKGKVGVYIELKYYGHDQRLEERVAEIVDSLDMAQEVVVMSLSLKGIHKFRRLRPDWQSGLLLSVNLGALNRLDVDFFAANASRITRKFVQRAHRNSQQVIAWTVNDPLGISMMISRGVDGIITNKPALAVSVLAERADLSPPQRLLVELAGLFGKQPNFVEQ